jgi:D-alanyl-D-alanine-carboxypeptidase/D-alanyl-D-alanine-endopeptidase
MRSFGAIVGPLAIVFALAMPAPLRAQSPLLEEAIGLAGPAMFITSGAPGMLLVVVRGRDTVIQGYGETKKGNQQEPNGKSLLRLGSITKVFAGELLGSLVVDGKLRLADALGRFGPPGATVPKFGDREITLLDLATHSAGLPREMGYAPEGTPPFTWPTSAARWAWLSGFRPQWAPGTVAAYSNVGFDLLADALSTAAGTPYAGLLQQRITGPLGMRDTGLTPSADQCARLMTGSGLGGPGECRDTQATAGSGGLYSTADDMAVWLRHNLATSDPKVWPTLVTAHAVYRQRQAMIAAIGFDEAGPMDGIGLGWLTLAARGHLPMIVDKSGGGGGFMTFIAFAPGRDVGVFVAVNRVDFAMFNALTAAATELIASLAPR